MLGTPARYAPFIDLSRGDLELLIALVQLRPAPGRRKRLALRLRVSEAAVKSRLMHLYLVTGLASMEDLADWWGEHRTEYVLWVAGRVGLEADDLRAALEGW